MQEMRHESLGWEDPLEKEMATPSSILAGESHGQRGLVGYSPWGHKMSQTLLSDKTGYNTICTLLGTTCFFVSFNRKICSRVVQCCCFQILSLCLWNWFQPGFPPSHLTELGLWPRTVTLASPVSSSDSLSWQEQPLNQIMNLSFLKHSLHVASRASFLWFSCFTAQPHISHRSWWMIPYFLKTQGWVSLGVPANKLNSPRRCLPLPWLSVYM